MFVDQISMIRRTGLNMSKKIFRIIGIISLSMIVCAAGFGLVFPNTSALILSLVTQTLPSKAHVARIRDHLLSQENFVKMLAKHERHAIRRWRDDGQHAYAKKYIHKTPISMFDLRGFHDYW